MSDDDAVDDDNDDGREHETIRSTPAAKDCHDAALLLLTERTVTVALSQPSTSLPLWTTCDMHGRLRVCDDLDCDYSNLSSLKNLSLPSSSTFCDV